MHCCHLLLAFDLILPTNYSFLSSELWFLCKDGQTWVVGLSDLAKAIEAVSIIVGISVQCSLVSVVGLGH